MHQPANRQPPGVEFLKRGRCYIRPRDILCRQRRDSSEDFTPSPSRDRCRQRSGFQAKLGSKALGSPSRAAAVPRISQLDFQLVLELIKEAPVRSHAYDPLRGRLDLTYFL
jgi:hypothetical protein